MKSMTLVNIMPRLGGETTLPTGLLYIAAVLENTGCQVNFRDYQVTYEGGLTLQHISDILDTPDETIGISCLFNALPFVLHALRVLKAETPEKTIILGGPGPSSVAENMMQAFPYIDVIVRGEGEHTITELAQGVPYRNVKGIVFRSGQTVITTSPRERIHDLDEVPFPACDKIDLTQYDHVGVITARGCPYQCAFCEVAPLWGHHTERRSIPNVMDEITFLHDYGVTDFHINDDTFVLDEKWVLQFCKVLQREKLDMTWKCNGRVDLMSENLLRAMAQAGCIGIQYGIESGSEAVLKRIRKQISIPQIKEVLRMSIQYMDTIANFMWGFPFETMEDFYETIYLMGVVAEMGAQVSLFLLAPTPLSGIYQDYFHQLKFSEELISNLFNVFDGLSYKEKDELFHMIREYPHIFSGFYHVHTAHIEEKFTVLKAAGFI
jgi:anaerobic magnesium-protoporphyrin IX monomethyl ester cyclase